MKTEVPYWAPPLLALQFLTRVPVPAVGVLAPEVIKVALVRATGWFPLVGAMIGLATALTVSLCDAWWPRPVAVLLALLVEARLTGAFHEDAVADTCDALGGGRDPAHVREIMKDSRIGSYGALGLVLALGLRASTMMALPASMLVPVIVSSSAFGRLLAVLAMRVVPPSEVSPGLGKDIGGHVAPPDLALALLFAAPFCAWFAFLMPLHALGALLAATAFLYWYRSILMLKVGGSTGDCLGFAAYAGQLIVLLAASFG